MSGSPCCPIALAVVAIDIARGHLARYSLETDSPEPGVVDAADMLDAARDALTEGAHHEPA